MSEPRARRALSNVGGLARADGDPRIAEILKRALETPPGEDAHREHVHGFHSYPARLHPAIARAVVEGLAPRAGDVLDPFCGSGTVTVEARLAGRRALGTDLNPLAVRLAALKTEGRPAAHREALVAAAHRVAAVANERRTKRAGASRRFPDEDVQSFPPHVLLELDGLRVGLEAEPEGVVRGDLWLVLSAILTKLSNRRGDATEGLAPKRIAAGYPSRLFIGKTTELATRLAEYEALLPTGVMPPRLTVDDATKLASIRDASVDFIVTSPPYPGNYDYLAHHSMRLRWLGLSARRFDEGEIGARRHLTSHTPDDARAKWTEQLRDVLSAMRRVLRPGGGAVLVLADSVVARRAIYNDDVTRTAARAAGMNVVARAWQERPHFHEPSRDAFRARPRCEHAIYLNALHETPRRR
jgi:DNA modification methylase